MSCLEEGHLSKKTRELSKLRYPESQVPPLAVLILRPLVTYGCSCILLQTATVKQNIFGRFIIQSTPSLQWNVFENYKLRFRLQLPVMIPTTWRRLMLLSWSRSDATDLQGRKSSNMHIRLSSSWHNLFSYSFQAQVCVT